MKLKSINGKVPYVMAAGKDFVKDEMSLAAAEQICSRGTQTASKLFPDFPICVDDKFYFAGTSTKPKSSKSKTPFARAEIFNLPVVRHHCRSPLSEITHG